MPKSRKRIYFLLLLSLLLGIGLLIRFWPHEPLKQRFPYSVAVYDEQQNLLRLTTAKDQKYRLYCVGRRRLIYWVERHRADLPLRCS